MHLGFAHVNKVCRYLILLTNILALAACSFSDSSVSISDSTSSIISSPSSISGESKKYRNEIADYTVAYVKSSKSDVGYSSYFKGISEIAAKSGIANWDQDPLTYMGIGLGLKRTGVEGVAYETYRKNFGNNDYTKMDNIQKGYEAGE